MIKFINQKCDYISGCFAIDVISDFGAMIKLRWSYPSPLSIVNLFGRTNKNGFSIELHMAEVAAGDENCGHGNVKKKFRVKVTSKKTWAQSYKTFRRLFRHLALSS